MRRALRSVVLVAVAVALMEVISLAAGSMLFGTGFVAQSRRARARTARLGAKPALPAEEPQVEVASSINFYSVHPYLGFVADPASRVGPARDSNGALETTDLGFFRRAGEVRRGDGDTIRVGVFGGSVAFLFSLTVDDQLEALLAERAHGREVVVESFAIPGYKQPQQLFALEYLLLLGERFDLVLNIDGFNEMVLPLTENVPQGTAAIYPRSWAHLVGSMPGPTLLASAGRLASLRATRRAVARVLSWPMVDWSATGALTWQLSESLLEPRIAAAEAALVHQSADGEGYGETGPRSTTDDADVMLDRMVEVWRRSSLLMHQVCAANGIAYVHVLQPNQYVPGTKLLGAEERAVAYTEDSPYREAVEEGYPRLAAAGESLREAGVHFVDATQIFSAVNDQIYLDDCCHLNRLGNTMLAEKLAPIVRAALTQNGPGVLGAGTRTRGARRE